MFSDNGSQHRDENHRSAKERSKGLHAARLKVSNNRDAAFVDDPDGEAADDVGAD